MKYFVLVYLVLGIFLKEVLTLLPSPLDGTPNVHQRTDKKALIRIDPEDIEESIKFAVRYTGYLKRFEKTIKETSQIVSETPQHGSFMLLEPEWTAIERGRNARLALKTSLQLAYSTCYENHIALDECNERIQQISLRGTSLGYICDHLNIVCSPEKKLDWYRSIDGTCNNVDKGSIGESYTAFSRFLNPKYLNHFETVKRSATKEAMPSAREVSTAFVLYGENPHPYLTLAFSQWGQFIAHDLSRFASSVMVHYNNSFRCCDENGFNLPPRYTHPFCMPISIPSDDKYYKEKRIQCMDYVRTLPALRHDCSLGHMEQQNQVTHYLDGSQIYGSTSEQSRELRKKTKGKLKSSVIGNKTFLPLLTDARQHCLVSTDKDACFESGDPRVNFMPQLAIMHTLWLREHNRLAKELAHINEDWDDETLFQEARKIVIAEMQHITYNEWINHLLDETHLVKLQRQSIFNKMTNPTVSNEFASAAIEVLYSMIPENISIVDKHAIENSTLRLMNHFNNPEIVITAFDSLLKGLVTQKAQKIGLHYPTDITNNLFANENFGYDILSLDIQRGRDHGLPGYNVYRQLCGLKAATKFEDFSDVMLNSSVPILSKIYKHVDDVDLIIGGLLEQPVNSILGPTLSCIIADQFIRTREGDRYFYTNSNQPKPFTALQLAEIKKITLARIVCDNSGVGNIQRRVFEKISERNLPLCCADESIPKLNLMVWNNDREKYHE